MLKLNSCPWVQDRSRPTNRVIAYYLADLYESMTPHLLEVAVERQLLLVGRVHLGTISDDPDGLLEPLLERLGCHRSECGIDRSELLAF